MKINDIIQLLESPVTGQVEHHKEITELKFLEMLKDNCRNSYGVIRQSPIYIADKSFKSNFLVVTPDVREIKTAFWLDRMVKEMNAWKRFPSRSKFLKGYTTIDRAGDESTVYVMIPYDMTRVGICPAASFYRSFTKAQKDFGTPRLDNDGLSSWIVTLAKGLNSLDSELDLSTEEPESIAQFTKALKAIDKALEKKEHLKKKLKEHDTMKDEEKVVVRDLLHRYVTTAQSYIDEKLDPEENGFSCVRVESFTRPSDVREVWIDKPCLLIKRDKYLEMHKRGAVK